MGTFVFKWPHAANEVYVTGTFDDWGKSVKLDKKGDIFEKEVTLPSTEKVLYKFVVDDNWVIDHTAPQEDDGHSNVNNVLHPSDIKTSGEAAIMSGVTPESTTAGLAGEVPKEERKEATTEAPEGAAISSAAPESTTAELAKDVPLEKNTTSDSAGLPGAFPETPANEPDAFSVKPIPATSGIDNPVKLEPGEKVPDPSTLTSNTVESTATTDQASYEKGADTVPAELSKEGETKEDSTAFSVPPVSNNMIPESSLPVSEGGKGPDTTDTGPTIQSAAPESTTAALAGQVPLESKGQATVVEDAPAPTNSEQKEDTKAEEPKQEDAGKSEEPSSAAAPGVPEPVKESITEAKTSPEAAANEEAVEEKKAVEGELKKEVKPEERAGEPAPTDTAATTLTAPESKTRHESRDLSPHSKPNQETGAIESKDGPAAGAPTPATTGTESAPTKDKKKKRASGFWGKLKEKLK